VALGLPDSNSLQVKAFLASWLHHLVWQDTAKTLFASLTVPDEKSGNRPTYHVCRARFSARDMPALKERLAIICHIGMPEMQFLWHDVIFDQFRQRDWF
jgi:hypothetical protein